jgi:nucleoside-diphosphate-sugar epimerase
MNSDHTGPINIGNPTEFTILELAHLVQEMTGSPSPILFKPLPSDDPKQRRPDITKAQTLLGWKPTISLKEGLAKTIAYFSSSSRHLPITSAASGAASFPESP